MADPPSPAPPARRPRRRWLRRALWAVLLLAAVLLAGGWYLTRPQRLAGLLAAAIESFAPVQAHADAAHLSMNGQLTLDGLRLRINPPEGGSNASSAMQRLFEVEQVLIDPSFTDLVRGRLAADAITLIRPTAYLIEDLQTGRFNIQNLATGEDEGEIPQTLPEVFIRGGHIRFGEVDGEAYTALGELGIDGRLIESRRHRGEYILVVRQTSADQVGEGAQDAGPVLRGTMRLGGAFQARAILEHFSIEAPHRNLLPRRVRTWWDKLSPRGSLPTVEVAYDADPAVGLQAAITLEHGAISLPYGDFAPRMTDVSGRFVARGDTITIENLTGKVAGIRYTIDGEIDGFETDAAFDLTARTEPFTLAENPYYLSLLSPKIRKHYARFNPSGTFAATLNLQRREAGGDIGYGGELAVINARGAYHKFPFPLHDVQGTIRFSDQKVEIVDLRGSGPSGGELVISGVIAPPGNGAAVDMRIVVTSVPIDEHLTGALKDKHRDVVETFLNPRQYQRLVERGLVRSSDPGMQAFAPAGGGDAPLFDLGGVLSAVVEIHREFGPDVDYLVTTTIDTTGAGMLCEHWPYPLKSAGGTLVIGPDSVVVDNVQARGLSGGAGIVDGVIERPTKNDLIPRIELRDVRLPIDPLLLASLPNPQDEWVRDLGVEGAIVGDGEIFEDDAGEIDFTLRAEFADASADPFRSKVASDGVAATQPAERAPSPTRLRELTGSFTVSRSHLDLDRITGRSGDTTLSISGDLDWQAEPIDIRLRLSAAGLELSPNLLSVLPADHPARIRLHELLAAYQPTSRFAGELDYRSRAADRPEDFTLTLKPASLAFDWHGQRVAFDAVTGAVVVRPGEVEIKDLAADFEHGRAVLAGQVPFGASAGDRPWTLRLTAAGDGFDANARALMPDSVVDAIDALELTGGYDLTGSLVGASGQDITFNAGITLTDAAANVGVPIRALSGELLVTAIQPHDARWPHLDLRLEATSLRAAERLIEPLTVHLVSGEAPDTLDVREMAGRIYGGSLIGKGYLLLEDPGLYHFDFTLNNVDLDPVVDPAGASASDDHAASDGGGTAPGGGKLAASLSIEAVPGRPQTRSGRGELQVADAELFEKPLTMAILHAANLSLPTHRAFDRASARYLVDGDTIRFDTLRFESPTVAIVGAGTMDYPTQQLDLALVTRNPGAPNLGALSDMFNIFKDELLAIHVTGALDDPRARLVPFEGLRASWERIFGAPAANVTPQATPIAGE